MKPTLHKPVPMNTNVRIPEGWFGHSVTGRVVGVSTMHVIFHYIVLLDKPYDDNDFGVIQAVTVSGPDLESADGLTNWRFTLGSPEHNKYLEEVNAS